MAYSSNSPARLRFATREDVPTILRLIKELSVYEKLTDQCVATKEQIEATLFGERRFVETIIAEEQNRAVGFALYFHHYSTFLARTSLYLEDLYVMPEARGRGIGKLLLATLAKIAVERSCGRLEWSVLDWNRPAIDFYKSLGAESMSDWTVFRLSGEPLQILAKHGTAILEIPGQS